MEIKNLKKRSEVKQTESPIESKLLYWFRKYHLPVEIQYEVPPYRLDFALINGNTKIAVECDGKEFHSTLEQKDRDRIRDEFLKSHGWIVERFTGHEIYEQPWNIAKKILSYCYSDPEREQRYALVF